MPRSVYVVINDLHAGLEELREHLSHLRSLFEIKSTTPRRPRAGKPARRSRRPRKKPSPRVTAMRKLQGRYMSLVRSLPAARKAKARKIRESQGYSAALKYASGRKP